MDSERKAQVMTFLGAILPGVRIYRDECPHCHRERWRMQMFPKVGIPEYRTCEKCGRGWSETLNAWGKRKREWTIRSYQRADDEPQK